MSSLAQMLLLMKIKTMCFLLWGKLRLGRGENCKGTVIIMRPGNWSNRNSSGTDLVKSKEGLRCWLNQSHLGEKRRVLLG